MIIYIHTYYTGKFNSVKHVRVHDNLNSAIMKQLVFGGTIKEYRLTREC